jgi:hypothetical protein
VHNPNKARIRRADTQRSPKQDALTAAKGGTRAQRACLGLPV